MTKSGNTQGTTEVTNAANNAVNATSDTATNAVKSIKKFFDIDGKEVEGVARKGYYAKNADGTPFTGKMQIKNITVDYYDGYVIGTSTNGELRTVFENIGKVDKNKPVLISKWKNGSNGISELSSAIAYHNNGQISKCIKPATIKDHYGKEHNGYKIYEYSDKGTPIAEFESVGIGKTTELQRGKVFFEDGTTVQRKFEQQSHQSIEKTYSKETGDLTKIKTRTDTHGEYDFKDPLAERFADKIFKANSVKIGDKEYELCNDSINSSLKIFDRSKSAGFEIGFNKNEADNFYIQIDGWQIMFRNGKLPSKRKLPEKAEMEEAVKALEDGIKTAKEEQLCFPQVNHPDSIECLEKHLQTLKELVKTM